ncbi:MAG: FAD-binding protein, partial [Alphaproteobacteria bacterium]|nr:FAD-binding protein [Alphaproteobacteria bacterium]
MSPTLHIIGAGMAGLSAALTASARGMRVVVYEVSPHAGGRCRSYADKKLGMTIDNGNHLLLGANTEALGFLKDIGSLDTCLTRDPASFQFVDLATRKPHNIMPPRRFPGVPWYDWLRLVKLYNPAAHKTVAECVSPKSALSQRLIEPLCLAALNTTPQEASAAQLWQVISRLLSGGEPAWRYYVPKDSLSATFVLPAITRIKNSGGTFYFENAVKGMEREGDRITAINFAGGKQTVRPEDHVICAVPPQALGALLPEIAPDFTYTAILNGHFAWKFAGTMRTTMPIIGVLGGTAQWLFLHEGRISTTTSAADAWMEHDDETIAARLWEDTRRALFMQDAKVPPYRIIKEKRATIAATPENLA